MLFKQGLKLLLFSLYIYNIPNLGERIELYLYRTSGNVRYYYLLPWQPKGSNSALVYYIYSSR